MRGFYKLCSIATVSLCLLGSPHSEAQVQTARFISTSSNSGGFYEYLPAGYGTGSQSYPLMVFLGGSGELGNGTTDLPTMLRNGPPKLINAGTFPQTFTVNGSTFSFIVISPQFASTAQPSDIDAVITYAIQHYRVNVDRIYVTGLSLGGGSIWGYASLIQTFPAHKIAALLPICGAGLLDAPGGQNIANAGIAVYATHNNGDGTVPVSWTQNNIARINNASPDDPIPPVMTIFNAGGHDAWSHTYDPNFLNPDIGNKNAYQWMLQYSTSTVILPITLSNYTATLSLDQSSVLINWTTANEENNQYFILQRSRDGQQFTTLDTVASLGNTSTGHQYTDTDPSPFFGDNFYRLSQVDKDGKSRIYPVLKVTVTNETQARVRLSPNPAGSSVFLELGYPETGNMQVRLSDVQGRVLKTWQLKKEGAVLDQTLDLSHIPPGAYFLHIQGTTIHEVQQLIKK